MEKTLQDYKQELEPKSKEQLSLEFKSKRYRAINAFYIGMSIVVLVVVLRLTGVSILGTSINSLDEYIELRKNLIWFTIFERIFWVYLITQFANKLNIQPLGWQIFAFVTPILSLIVIGLTPKVDNNFYEYKTASDRKQYFTTLTLTEKLNLYRHILSRAKISPHWYDHLSNFNLELFADAETSLETLKHHEKIFGKNMLKIIKSNLPSENNSRQEFVKTLEVVGIND